MSRRELADQAFALLKHESQNTHVKLRAIAQTVIQTGDLPVGRQRTPDDCGNTQSTPSPAGTFFPIRATTRQVANTRRVLSCRPIQPHDWIGSAAGHLMTIRNPT